jgi:hypothetical protein
MWPVRYLFRGLRQQTGEPVEGRVTAPTEHVAQDILREDGIVADSLKPEPARESDAAAKVTEPGLAEALERALDDAGFGVSFDLVTGRYQGKSVCLLDQDKIRKRVMDLMDDAAVDDLRDDENRVDARRHIAQLLEQVLQYRRDLGSERSPQSQALEAQVNHIAQALVRIERAMASMSVAVRREGRSRPRRTVPGQAAGDKTQEEVLIEVFQHNLELIRGLEEPASPPAAGGGQAASRLA